jgi:hypothetical protein
MKINNGPKLYYQIGLPLSNGRQEFYKHLSARILCEAEIFLAKCWCHGLDVPDTLHVETCVGW